VIEKPRAARVIKTMGDAVMASFPTLDGARPSRPAIEMMRRARRREARFELGLGVKIGVHTGALPRRARERPARLLRRPRSTSRRACRRRPGASQVVLTEHAAEEPAIAARLGELSRTRFEARLKGIKEEQRLLAVERPRR
jgi:class 3 adenylate cyclase